MAHLTQDLQRRAESVAFTLPPLLIAAQRVAASVLQGVHGRRRSGPGETFWQFRRYQPTDPVTSVDWRQSAKSQWTYVREQEWEASQSVWLWCDHTRSMKFCSKENLETKEVRALILSLALASLLLRAGEQVGVAETGGKAFRGIGVLPRLADVLATPSEITDISHLPQLTLPRHAQVILMGDFLDPISTIGSALKWFNGQGLSGHLVQILDPAEETLPFRGRARFVDLEMEGEVVVNRVEAVREDYARHFAVHQESLSEIASQMGWTLLTHRTDRPAEVTLLSLYLNLSDIFRRTAR